MFDNHGRSNAKRDRRGFLRAVGGITASLAFSNDLNCSQAKDDSTVKIVDVSVSDGVTLVANNGAKGSFKGSGAQNPAALKSHMERIRELLIGHDPLDRRLDGEMLREANRMSRSSNGGMLMRMPDTPGVS